MHIIIQCTFGNDCDVDLCILSKYVFVAYPRQSFWLILRKQIFGLTAFINHYYLKRNDFNDFNDFKNKPLNSCRPSSQLFW